jgi:hypothetical protein
LKIALTVVVAVEFVQRVPLSHGYFGSDHCWLLYLLLYFSLSNISSRSSCGVSSFLPFYPSSLSFLSFSLSSLFCFSSLYLLIDANYLADSIVVGFEAVVAVVAVELLLRQE